jgi:arsenate reductase
MKKVLFVCIENSCRSQMAEGLAREFGKDILEAYSAGSKPSREVNPNAIKVMKEIDIDISSYKPKGFKDLPIKTFDYVITLGCGDICPFIPAKEHIDWLIDDPKGKEIEYFRKTRDFIEDKVKGLRQEIKLKSGG